MLLLRIGTSSAADVQLAPQWAFLSFYYYQAYVCHEIEDHHLFGNECLEEIF